MSYRNRSAQSALPSPAAASLLSPELEDSVATFIAVFVIFVVPCVLIALFWMGPIFAFSVLSDPIREFTVNSNWDATAVTRAVALQGALAGVVPVFVGKDIPKPSGMTDLRVMALSRVMLDNFPHIKAYWQMLTVKVAQVAQSFGADDIDGTVVHETIYHAAGSDSPQDLHLMLQVHPILTAYCRQLPCDV